MASSKLTQRQPMGDSIVQKLTAADLERMVPERGIAMIEFTAHWCSACQSFREAFTQLSAEHTDIFFGQIDVEKERLVARRFAIEAVPTLAVIHDRALVFRHVGALSFDALQDLLSQVRALAAETATPAPPKAEGK